MDSRGGFEDKTVREDGCICPEETGPPPPEVEEEVRRRKIATCPYDPRFPNQNTTKRCFYSFVDYQRCARLLGDYPGCLYFLRCYKSLCPLAWQEKWFSQMENNTFPTKIYPSKPIIYPNWRKALNALADEEDEEGLDSEEC